MKCLNKPVTIKEMISNQSSFPAQKDILSPADFKYVFPTLQETDNTLWYIPFLRIEKEGKILNSFYKARMSLITKLQDNTKGNRKQI